MIGVAYQKNIMYTKIELAYHIGDSFRSIKNLKLKLENILHNMEIRSGRLKNIGEIAIDNEVEKIFSILLQINDEFKRIKEDEGFWNESTYAKQYQIKIDKILQNDSINLNMQLKSYQNILELINNINSEYIDKLNGYRKIVECPNVSEMNGFIQDDIILIINLISMGYYRTALFVVGRAIETIYRKIGEKRKIKKVKVNDINDTIPWKKVNFNGMNKVLYIIPQRKSGSPVLRKIIVTQVSPIIMYRNLGAHPIEAEELKKIEDNIIHHINIGLNLIKELNEVYNKIPKRSAIPKTPEIDSLRI